MVTTLFKRLNMSITFSDCSPYNKLLNLFKFVLISDNDELNDFLKILVDDIQTLTKSSEVFIFKPNAVDKKEFAKSFSGIISDLEVYLPFQDFVNIDALKERLNKDLKKVTIELDNLNKRLSN